MADLSQINDAPQAVSVNIIRWTITRYLVKLVSLKAGAMYLSQALCDCVPHGSLRIGNRSSQLCGQSHTRPISIS